MTVTTDDRNRQNIFAKEPPIIMTDHPYGVPHNERAELLNGRLAMLGFVAAVISYLLTGKLFFGIY
jgi:Chlorophyll A-B binding protein